MKLCPTCQRCYEDADACCARDQAMLVSWRSGPRQIAHKYSLDRLLRHDWFDADYTGTRLDDGHPVIVKLLRPSMISDPEQLKGFRREAHGVAHLNTRIDHPHVARTYDYGALADGSAYIVTECITGQTLREYMDEVGPLPLADFIRIAQQLADGLGAAHRCGVMHGDLNPRNIIITRAGGEPDVKIIDFSLAKLRSQTFAKCNVPAPAEALFDAALYMAPEHHAGGDSEARTDVYSCGVILYEMLTGHLPPTISTASAHDTDSAEELLPLKDLRADLPVHLAGLVLQALCRKPSARPPNMMKFSQQFRLAEPARDEESEAALPDPDRAASLQTVPKATSAPPVTAGSVSPAPSAAVRTQGAWEPERRDAPAGAPLIIRTSPHVSPEEQKHHAAEVTKPGDETSNRRPTRNGHPAPPDDRADDASSSLDYSPAPIFAHPRADHEPAAENAAAPRRRQPRLVYTVYAVAILLGCACGWWLAVQPPLSLTRVNPLLFAKSSPGNRAIDDAGAASASEVDTDAEARAGVPSADETVKSSYAVPAGAAPPIDADAETGSAAPRPAPAAESSSEPATSDNPIAKPALTPPAAASRPTPKQQLAEAASPTPGQRANDVRRCSLSVNESSLVINNNGGSGTVTVNLDDPAGGTPNVSATTPDWSNIVVFSPSRTVTGSGSMSYSIRSVSKQTGTFNVTFGSRCGSRSIRVTVK